MILSCLDGVVFAFLKLDNGFNALVTLVMSCVS